MIKLSTHLSIIIVVAIMSMFGASDSVATITWFGHGFVTTGYWASFIGSYVKWLMMCGVWSFIHSGYHAYKDFQGYTKYTQ